MDRTPGGHIRALKGPNPPGKSWGKKASIPPAPLGQKNLVSTAATTTAEAGRGPGGGDVEALKGRQSPPEWPIKICESSPCPPWAEEQEQRGTPRPRHGHHRPHATDQADAAEATANAAAPPGAPAGPGHGHKTAQSPPGLRAEQATEGSTNGGLQGPNQRFAPGPNGPTPKFIPDWSLQPRSAGRTTKRRQPPGMT